VSGCPPEPADRTAAAGGKLVDRFRAGSRQLLNSWRTMERAEVLITDRVLPFQALEIVGAVEIAVHGWDVLEGPRPAPPDPGQPVAGPVAVVPWVISDLIRPGLFAAPVRISPLGSPSDRLVALLGRQPRRDDFSVPFGS
jgi:hypothetical protein